MWTQGLTPNQEAIPKKGKIRFLQWSISGYINHTPGQDPMTRRNWLIQIDSMHFKHFVLFWYYCCLIDFLFFHCFFLYFGRLGGRFFTCFFFFEKERQQNFNEEGDKEDFGEAEEGERL